MQVAEVIVRILESEGIEAAFGIPGAAINPVYEHLGTSKQIKHYLARLDKVFAIHDTLDTVAVDYAGFGQF